MAHIEWICIAEGYEIFEFHVGFSLGRHHGFTQKPIAAMEKHMNSRMHTLFATAAACLLLAGPANAGPGGGQGRPQGPSMGMERGAQSQQRREAQPAYRGGGEKGNSARDRDRERYRDPDAIKDVEKRKAKGSDATKGRGVGKEQPDRYRERDRMHRD